MFQFNNAQHDFAKSKMITKFRKIKTQKGALLLELLIVISLVAVILSVGTNAVFLSLRSNKIGGERDVANALASEVLEAVRAATEENWQNIYGLIKSSQHYQIATSSGKWVLNTGDEAISLNGIDYTRYVTIDNVSRDDTTRSVQNSYVSADDDPGTQKVTVTVSWSDGNPVVLYEYFFRWKNKVCNQTSWTGGVGSGAKTCPDTTYGSQDGNLDTSGGQLKLQ
ncbi:hypothetical protein A2818_01665 [Candidatus Nomurabacteria bacterium RIFCSPHIGHO2_01_FULL_40_12]|uniref:Uncharacterized protein n=1 Tax=Candidatus Nomurabacteria bacterium RIFCSPHIGHO2_01_FULL_40_12 TaxID=1801737 RepID=A0A1F6V0A6_9BACT|nr:MAG: hypothetical protein A2818_01665 [Candidatus Nomurabacteria bacterium RIFCSPHIGHO2_01_FULL_40_12]